MSFREVKPEELNMNPFSTIGKNWLLVSAGTPESCNTMTASWGGAGVMWGKNAVTVYIRPQRYTKEFIDREELFTVSVLPEEYRNALKYCGTVTGKGIDKIKEAGLSAEAMDGTVGIGEAGLILVCRKMYHDTIKPECFDDTSNDEKWYPQKDYHTMYIAQVVKAYVKD